MKESQLEIMGDGKEGNGMIQFDGKGLRYFPKSVVHGGCGIVD